MKRITKKSAQGYYYPECFERCSGMPGTNPIGGKDDGCDGCAVSLRICEILGRYEDSGLAPEEIAELRDSVCRLRRERDELARRCRTLEEVSGRQKNERAEEQER